MSGMPHGLRNERRHRLSLSLDRDGLTLAPILDQPATRTARASVPPEPLTEPTVDYYDPVYDDDDDDDDNNEDEVDDHDHGDTTGTIASLPVGSSTRDVRGSLAIRELVDPKPGPNPSPDTGQLALPSFVSLSVVEKSPTQRHANLNNTFPSKRPRLEPESTYDVNRTLPRPTQKDDQTRPVPLLPAMVTGLHDPPPSADLLPPIDPDARTAGPLRSTPGMHVQDLLQEPDRITRGRPPELMLNTPEVVPARLPGSQEVDAATPELDDHHPRSATALEMPRRDVKVRRTRRKWSEVESAHLQAGVKKHGFGKWKQILNDPEFVFLDRTSIDLKDRFRVFAKDFRPSPPAMIGEGDERDAEGVDQTSDSPSNTRPTLNTPSSKTRRRRHPWTKEEDEALTRGVQKHGFQWTEIHNDPDLKLGHRRATDLRDRIRNRHPEGYRTAESRPLRSEVRKAEKEGKRDAHGRPVVGSHVVPVVDSAPSTRPDLSQRKSSTVIDLPLLTPAPNTTLRRATTSTVPTLADIAGVAAINTSSSGTGSGTGVAHPRPERLRRARTTTELPSLEQTTEENADLEEWDNTLAPFLGT